MTKSIFAAALCWMRRTGNAPDLAAWQVASKQCFFSMCLALAGVVSAASIEAQTARESVQVPANGGAVTFTNSFDRGELFLLKAAGAVVLGQDLLDAEYGSAGATAPGMDLVSGTDVGIDIGLKAPRVPKGVSPGRMKWFGSYRVDHTYYLLFAGTGQPIHFHYYDSVYSDNSPTDRPADGESLSCSLMAGNSLAGTRHFMRPILHHFSRVFAFPGPRPAPIRANYFGRAKLRLCPNWGGGAQPPCRIGSSRANRAMNAPAVFELCKAGGKL